MGITRSVLQIIKVEHMHTTDTERAFDLLHSLFFAFCEAPAHACRVRTRENLPPPFFPIHPIQLFTN